KQSGPRARAWNRLTSQKPGGAVEAIPSPRYRWLYLKHDVSDALPTSDRLRVPGGDISESVADHPNRAVRTHSTSRKTIANPPPTNQRRSGTTVPLETGTKSSSTAMSLSGAIAPLSARENTLT